MNESANKTPGKRKININGTWQQHIANIEVTIPLLRPSWAYRNKCININSKLSIYETLVRPVMRSIRDKPDNSKTIIMMSNIVIKSLRMMHGYTLGNRTVRTK